MRRLRLLRLQPRNLNGVFVAANGGGLRPATLAGWQCMGVKVNVCREPLRMLSLDVLLRVLVQVEMDNRPLLKSNQQDRAKNRRKLLMHLYLY